MPEEVNRVVCDYVSDLIFVYTTLYKKRLIRENKDPKNIFIVGNTITEIVKEYMPKGKKRENYLVADIHRNENLKTKKQYLHVLNFLNRLGERSKLPVKLVYFQRAVNLLGKIAFRKFKNIDLVGPYGFIDYLKLQYHAYAVISDSGTSQEECPLLKTPVIVPRNSTERPESIEKGNSVLIGENKSIESMIEKSTDFLKSYSITRENIKWLGDGKTSQRILDILREKL